MRCIEETGTSSRRERGSPGRASFAVKHIIKRFADDEGIDPGQMFLLNDPYVAAVHQSDVYIMALVHVDGRLVAWSATFVHVMDIGARSPGWLLARVRPRCARRGFAYAGIKLIERGSCARTSSTPSRI